jgi:hypothetical protein
MRRRPRKSPPLLQPVKQQASASQVRTAVAMPDDVKLSVGTPETETALNLDKEGRIDLQLRLGALGHVTGGADGALGARSRTAIGAWQQQNGMVETTYLTQQQHMFLVVQTDPMMPQIRAQYEAQKAAIAVRKAQNPVRQKVAGQRVKRQHNDGQPWKARSKETMRNGPGRGGFCRRSARRRSRWHHRQPLKLSRLTSGIIQCLRSSSRSGGIVTSSADLILSRVIRFFTRFITVKRLP